MGFDRVASFAQNKKDEKCIYFLGKLGYAERIAVSTALRGLAPASRRGGRGPAGTRAFRGGRGVGRKISDKALKSLISRKEIAA